MVLNVPMFGGKWERERSQKGDGSESREYAHLAERVQVPGLFRDELVGES